MLHVSRPFLVKGLEAGEQTLTADKVPE